MSASKSAPKDYEGALRWAAERSKLADQHLSGRVRGRPLTEADLRDAYTAGAASVAPAAVQTPQHCPCCSCECGPCQEDRRLIQEARLAALKARPDNKTPTQ